MNNKQKVTNKNKLNRLNQQIANIKKEIDEESQEKKRKHLNIKLKSLKKQQKEIIKRLKKLESNVKKQKKNSSFVNDSVSNSTFIKDTGKQVKEVAHHIKQKFNSNSEIFLRKNIKPRIDKSKELYDNRYNLNPAYQNPAYRQSYSKKLISRLQPLGKTIYEKNMIAKQVNDMFHEKTSSKKTFPFWPKWSHLRKIQ